MKKLAALFAACVIAGSAQAQLDNFNYSVGNLAGNGGWVTNNTGDDVAVVAGNLNYAGVPAIGNKIEFGGAGKEAVLPLTASVTSGTVYYSFILNVAALGSLNATGGYFANFTQGTLVSGSTFGSTIWMRLDGTGFNLGINPRTTVANTIWGGTTLTTSTSYFVVASYTFNSGAANDTVSLWINPTLDLPTPPSPTATATNTTGTDLTSVGLFQFRQDSTTTTAGIVDIDALRINTSWTQVAVPEPREYALAISGLLGALVLIRRRVRMAA